MKRAIIGTAVIASALAAAGCSGNPFAEPRPLVAAPSVCGTQRFDVYFADSQAGLTPAARQAISLTATALQGCDIRAVRVTGLSDARGGAAANLTLSQRRAQAVAEALEAAGWPAPMFEVEAAGSQGATDAAGVAEPLRRRTEVVVEAAPR
ncbi:OmpA family protein [Brevundimonas sp. VNH65]|uniref:OmpA family protein n=1 Tax=Brevundimonas sp. VNH65 TaxID=3400917 RepID=UPI003C06E774